jgi:predicted deacylase
METVYEDQSLPIRVLRTDRKGPAVWLLAGIHGEEPAPPDAVAASTAAIAALAERGIPMVVFPLCNPVGYLRGWRYPDAAERRLGHSVGDSDHLLLDKAGKPRLPAPASPQSAALTAKVRELARDYPPVLSVDLHEDDSLPAGYIYSQGRAGCADPAAKAVLAKMRQLKYPVKLSGQTDFDEKIRGGIICDVNDGSIDELVAAAQVYAEGRVQAGPAGGSVIVVETSSMKAALPRRARLHRAIIGMLAELFSAAGKPRPAAR